MTDATRITTDANYDADLVDAENLLSAQYDATGFPEGEGVKHLNDSLNNAWVEGITVAEWVERASV